LRNLIRSRIEREMTAVDDVNLGVRDIAPIRVKLGLLAPKPLANALGFGASKPAT
jgi:hypothetical protein